jgi:hypothetical protein
VGTDDTCLQGSLSLLDHKVEVADTLLCHSVGNRANYPIHGLSSVSCHFEQCNSTRTSLLIEKKKKFVTVLPAPEFKLSLKGSIRQQHDLAYNTRRLRENKTFKY